MDRDDYDILDEPAVYPGHPITLACLIANLYPSLDAAEVVPTDQARVHRYPAALEDHRIPGAGGNVWDALELLRRLRSGHSVETVIAWADETWAYCDGQATTERLRGRWDQGQRQADHLKGNMPGLAAWTRGEVASGAGGVN